MVMAHLQMIVISRKQPMVHSSKEGVISQIVNKGLPEEIDAVSRATCSSNAIVAGCEKALEEAKRPEKTEAE